MVPRPPGQRISAGWDHSILWKNRKSTIQRKSGGLSGSMSTHYAKHSFSSMFTNQDAKVFQVHQSTPQKAATAAPPNRQGQTCSPPRMQTCGKNLLLCRFDWLNCRTHNRKVLTAYRRSHVPSKLVRSQDACLICLNGWTFFDIFVCNFHTARRHAHRCPEAVKDQEFRTDRILQFNKINHDILIFLQWFFPIIST